MVLEIRQNKLIKKRAWLLSDKYIVVIYFNCYVTPLAINSNFLKEVNIKYESM